MPVFFLLFFAALHANASGSFANSVKMKPGIADLTVSHSSAFNKNLNASSRDTSWLFRATAYAVTSGLNSEIVVRLINKTGVTRGFDNSFDARQFRGTGVNLATIPLPALFLVINQMPIPSRRDTLPLSFTSVDRGAHHIDFKFIPAMLADSFQVYLYDTFTDSTHNLAVDTVVNFQVTTNALSMGDNRFKMIFMPPSRFIAGNKPAINSAAKFSISPNPASDGQATILFNNFSAKTAEIIITDAAGRRIRKQSVNLKNGAANLEIETGLNAGIYHISCTTPEGAKIVQKLVIQ
ncbi:MAG: T9SS type A sorting domain-containing protein [Bacteroidota bacterium]